MLTENKTRSRCGLVALLIGLACTPSWAAICRVSATGSDFNNGSSWAVPTSLKQALITGTCTEIWVAKGVHKPTASGTVTSSFNLASGVAVYGGFAGSESARDQRSPATNATVLSGDIDNNDTSDDDGVNADATHIVGSNSFHVVRMAEATSNTILDGVTITGGDASGADSDSLGGGLYCQQSLSGTCNPTFANLVFSGNKAGGGGALYIGPGAGPSLSNVTFRGNSAGNGGAVLNSGSFFGVAVPTFGAVAFIDNSATAWGGAMFNQANGGSVNFTVTNATFQGNSADQGGAIFNYGTGGAGSIISTFNSITFSGNHATNGGAIANVAESGTLSIPKLNNVTLSGNIAASGGAIYNWANGGTSGTKLFNVTLSGNQASLAGGAIYNKGSAASGSVRNAIMWGNLAPGAQGPEIYNLTGAAPAIDHSIVQSSGGSGAFWNTSLGTDGGGNLDADPLLAALSNNGGFTLTMPPVMGSPAIDTGNATGCPPTDQRGVTRPQGLACDIGAVEYLDILFDDGFENTVP